VNFDPFPLAGSPQTLAHMPKIGFKTKKKSENNFLLPCLRNVQSGLNFTNNLRAAFTLIDPKCLKMTVNLSIFFLRFWDLQAKKPLYKTYVKFTPAINFINVLNTQNFGAKKLQSLT